MAGPIRISILANGSQARQEMDRLSGSAKRMADKVGKYAAVGVAVVGAAAVKVAKDSIEAASEAEQSIGATQAIYGKFADQVIKKSNEAAEAVGLSANSYRESSNLLAALFKNQGTELSKLSAKTDDHLKLAADLSAQYGGDVTLAVEALTAAYKGEFNQLEKYGVTLKQSIINTEAETVAKQKYGKALKDLSPKQAATAQQLATQNLLFKQTGDAAGAFGREANTLAGKQQRLAAKIDNVKVKIGQALLPVMTDLADFSNKEIVPLLERFSEYLVANKDDIRATAQEWGGRFLDALKGVWGVAKPFLETLNAIPGPMKELILQTTLLAAAMGRLGFFSLTASLAAMSAAARNTANSTGQAATKVSALGLAARNVAGVAGMLALVQSTQQSDDKMKALLSTAGGAAVGFSVGGPIGAAVGGLAGLMLGLRDGTNRAEIAAKNSQTTWQTYASTLDSVTGATTRATKAMVIQDLQQNGTLAKARELDISQRDLVNGILGQKAARDRLNGAIRDEEQAIKDAGRAYMEKYDTSIKRNTEEGKAAFEAHKARIANLDAIKAEVGEVQKATKAKREELLLLQNFPDLVITKIQTPGAVDSKRELADLVATYGLTPKQIQTVIKMNGINTSKKEVQDLAKEIVESGNVKPSDAWAGQFKNDVDRTRRETEHGLGLLDSALLGTGQVKPKIADGPFGRGVSGDLTALLSVATNKSNGVGDNLGRGMYGGMGPWIQPIADRARAMVAGAIAAANGAAAIRSPSRKTRYTGSMLGAGLVAGVEASRPAAKRSGRRIVFDFLSGVNDGVEGVQKALEKTTALVRKSITGKNQAAREKTVLRSLKDEYDALRRNGRAQDAVTKKLTDARQKLKDLVEQSKDYAANIKTAVIATGDITQLGQNEDGSASAANIIRQLKDRVVAAQRFSVLIANLTKSGLNQTAIQQMIDAGVEGGLATAEALAAGGPAAISEINSLQKDLEATGKTLGDSTAKTMYGAGIKAAEGLIKGLQADSKALDAAATALAAKLTTAVKRALGIRSPSRVFQSIGDNVTKGLVIGLDEKAVERQGLFLAHSLQDGFDRPTLQAALDARTGSSKTTITVRLTAEQVSAVQRGREIQIDLDAYRQAGGRSAA